MEDTNKKIKTKKKNKGTAGKLIGALVTVGALVFALGGGKKK